MKLVDLTGRQFGRLTVLALHPKQDGDHSHRRWLCRCECGQERVVIGSHLTGGFSRSCGRHRPKKPPRPKRQARLPKHGRLTHDGLTLSVAGWARRLGISRQALWNRLEQGWTVEEALTRPKG